MQRPRPVEIPVVFHRTAGGNEPVIEWLRSLPAEDRRVIGTDLATVQFGWPVGMPLCRSLGGGLWEVRSSLAGRRIARVLFFVGEGRIGVVHGFYPRRRRRRRRTISISRDVA